MKLRNSRVKEYRMDSTGSRGGPVTSYYSQDEAHSGSTKGEEELECLANLYGFEDFLMFFFAPCIVIKFWNINQRDSHI
jgi:hypothetical protein